MLYAVTSTAHSPQQPVLYAVRAAVLLPLLLALLLGGSSALAESKETIETKATEAIALLIEHAPESKELLDKARGVLIFPHIVKMGFGVGAQYGEGVLRVGGVSTGYYSTAGASFGLQLGAQTKSEAVLFMSDEALSRFKSGHVFGKIDSSQWRQRVLAFIFCNQGLMGNLSLEGSKITRIAR